MEGGVGGEGVVYGNRERCGEADVLDREVEDGVGGEVGRQTPTFIGVEGCVGVLWRGVSAKEGSEVREEGTQRVCFEN
jgi:hypothetical protein